MADYTVDLRDIRFVLYEYLGVDGLTKMSRFSDYSKSDFDMVLDSAYQMAREELAPVNEPGDKEGCHLEGTEVRMPEAYKKAYQSFIANGWNAPSGPMEYGGQGLPDAVAVATAEMFTGACCAFMMTPGLTLGAANLIKDFAPDEVKNLYLEKMYSGEWSGTMCLTEESAGSAVGDLRSKAVKEGDHYLIEGTKIFISSGEHDLTENIIHMVLARTEGAPKGTAGISLFIVPKFHVNPDGSLGERNDVVCPKIEEKMGIHGSSTCVLNFGDEGKCIGYLLGEENKGMRLMFHMMNEARLYVGLQGLSLAAHSYQQALLFAKERIQGTDILKMADPDAPRVPIVVHPDVRRMLLTQKAYVEGIRALIYQAAYHTDLMHASENDADKQAHKNMLDLLTPICKAYSSDMGFRVTELGMQVMGGYGYCAEYPAEQAMRDVKIASIYEGTNGIQALDLLGRKVSKGGGILFMQLLQGMNEWIGKNKDNEKIGGLVKKVDDAKNALAGVTFEFAGMGRKDPLYPIMNALPYLYIFGDTLCAYYLTQQAVLAQDKLDAIAADRGVTDAEGLKKLAADNPEALFYYNKVRTAEFFVHRILPNALANVAALKSGDHSCLEAVFPLD